MNGKLDAVLEEVGRFLTASKWLFDFANVRILSEDRLKGIPEEWRVILSNTSLSTLKENLVKPRMPCNMKGELARWVSQRYQLLEHLKQTLGVTPFEPLPGGENAQERVPLPKEVRLKMSIKKQSEVEAVANFIGQKCQKDDLDLVLDVGSGLAYLPQALSALYNLKVVCMECHSGHVQRAQVRIGHDKNIRMVKCKLEDSGESLLELEKFLSDFNCDRVFLVGLHCCGDLTPTMMRLFYKCSRLKSLLVLSCCYHKMKENQNMPMTTLQTIDFTPYLLRLGCQESFEKWSSRSLDEHWDHSKTFGYRAIIEKFCQDNHVQVRKHSRRCMSGRYQIDPKTFSDDFFKNYRLLNPDECDIEKLKAEFPSFCSNFSDTFELLEKITGLQLFLQSLVEYLIIGDRVRFMHHQSSPADVQVIEMFSEEISPRNKAVVSSKF